jgi:hypothetical protein
MRRLSSFLLLLLTLLPGLCITACDNPAKPSGPTLIDISIAGEPAKTLYTQGDAFTSEGLVVSATYSDGSSRNVTGYTLRWNGAPLAEGSTAITAAAGTPTVTVTYEGQTTGFAVSVIAPDATLISIAVASLPAKTLYTQGDAFSSAGLVVSAAYSDGSSGNITGYTLSWNGAALAEGSTAVTAATGEKPIAVAYEGRTAGFAVSVIAPGLTLVSIAVAASPAKTSYTLGDAFSSAGLAVRASYNDGSAAAVTGYTLSWNGAPLAEGSTAITAAAGTPTVTVAYEGRTAGFAISVRGPDVTLSAIAVASLPDQILYTQGDAFSSAGLVVSAAYDNGSSGNVTGYTLSWNGAPLAEGSTAITAETGTPTVTVAYEGQTAAFAVSVIGPDLTLVAIAVTASPTKTSYTQGDAFSSAGLAVRASYNDGSAAAVTGYTLSWNGASLTEGSTAITAETGTPTVTVAYEGRTAGFAITVNPAGITLTAIAVTHPPEKTDYVKGETLDLSGLTVTGTYSDGTNKPETVALSNISGYDADTTGGQTLTVTINGKTDTFTVTVHAVALHSIAITTPPAKTVYAKGEALNISGLEVTGTYTDGNPKQETVALSNISGYNANTMGDQTPTVTINGKTAAFTVTVNAAALLSIAVTTQPAKTVYAKGEALEISGLTVTGTYTDGIPQTETVTLSNISEYVPNTMGDQTLTVTVNGWTDTFTVTVNAAALLSIAITTPPAKTVYVEGETLDISGLTVTGTYTDGIPQTEPVTLSNISGYNAGSLGTQNLTVNVEGKTAFFTVKVQASAGFTVNLEDPLNVIPEGIVLYKTGTPASVVLTIAGTYADYAWYLNDNETPVSIGAAYTLQAADCRLGPNYLTVEAMTDGGVYYARVITFTVEE